jgi:hypothetical protein
MYYQLLYALQFYKSIEKMSIIKKIGIGIAVIFVMIIVIGTIGVMFTPTGRLTEISTEKTQPTETTLTSVQHPAELIVKGLGETIESGGLAVTLHSVEPETDYRPYKTEDYLAVTIDVNIIGDKIYISPGNVIDVRKYKLNPSNMGELTWNLVMIIMDSNNVIYTTNSSGILLGEKTTNPTLRLTGIFDNLGYSADNITIVLFGKDERYEIVDLTKFIFNINLGEINNIKKCEFDDINCIIQVVVAHRDLSYCYQAEKIFSCLYYAKLKLEPTNPATCEWVLEFINKSAEELVKEGAYNVNFYGAGAECYLTIAKNTLNVSYCDKIAEFPQRFGISESGMYIVGMKDTCYSSLRK